MISVNLHTSFCLLMMLRSNVVSSNPVHGEAYSIHHYVIKFVSDLRQVSGPVSATNKTDCHDISEILLKVINQTKPNVVYQL